MGHGHVIPNKDGSLARCGGPGICAVCALELQQSNGKPAESIVDKCNQPPIMEFEGFIIRPFDGWNLWFENPDGEGTMIQKGIFLGTLVKLFKETF